jgi:hypothetical protein
MSALQDPRSFFFHYPKIVKEIRTPIKISSKLDHNMEQFNLGVEMNLNVEQEGKHNFVAIWDTGATNSCVTKKAVDAVGLPQIGMTEFGGVYGDAVDTPLFT